MSQQQAQPSREGTSQAGDSGGESRSRGKRSHAYVSREIGYAVVESVLILTPMVVVVIVVLTLLGPAIGIGFSRLTTMSS